MRTDVCWSPDGSQITVHKRVRISPKLHFAAPWMNWEYLQSRSINTDLRIDSIPQLTLTQ